MTVVHETHRQRLLYSPYPTAALTISPSLTNPDPNPYSRSPDPTRYPTAELLALPELAALKINADLSHWCCVCD